jgi:PKD repeat protein
MKKHFVHFIRMLSLTGTFVLMFAASGYANPFAYNVHPPIHEPAPAEEGRCCAYSLQFVNLYEEKHIKKIRVSAMCDTRICCAESDAWAQDGQIPAFVDWYPADGSAVPYGNAIDNEFLIFLDSDNAPHNLLVEWFDLNDNIVCRHTIEISCDRDYKEDEDWTVYTSLTSLNDKNLFVFAVREPEEDEEGCDDDSEAKRSDCTFGQTIMCQGINTYFVTLNGPADYNSFTWSVVSGPSTPALASTSNPTMSLTASGSYVISLMAINTATSDTCVTQDEVVIPFFNPSFTTSRIPNLCSTKIEFTSQGGDPSTIASVSWACVGKPDFPTTGNTVTYDFLASGTYQVTMTIMDIYGCAHSITQNVEVSTVCKAGAKVYRYFLCPGCEGKRDIQVVFENLSTGGKCPDLFKWEFGDGQSATTTEAQRWAYHTYQQVDCKQGAIYYLTLTMTDSDMPKCTSTVTIPVVIQPCPVDFDTIVCPDGKVVCTGNMPGEWILPPAAVLSGWPYTPLLNADSLRDKVTMRLPDGNWPITFIGHCPTGGRCMVTKIVHVKQECCAKNDSDRDHSEFWESGKEYRMKYNMVQRQLPLIHHIKVKTKLKKHKKVLGIWYWKGTKADEIEASHNGTIFKSDTECNCKVPESTSRSEINYNKTKAKYREHINGKFRSHKDSLIGTHRAVKGSHTEIKNTYLGDDCDIFRWWTDWF